MQGNTNSSSDVGHNDDRDKASVVLNLACFTATIVSGFGLNYIMPDWTGIMFVYWSAFVLIIAPQVAIWSDSRRVKWAAWSGFLGAICLLIILFSGVLYSSQ